MAPWKGSTSSLLPAGAAYRANGPHPGGLVVRLAPMLQSFQVVDHAATGDAEDVVRVRQLVHFGVTGVCRSDGDAFSVCDEEICLPPSCRSGRSNSREQRPTTHPAVVRRASTSLRDASQLNTKSR